MNRFTKGILCALAGTSCWGFSCACVQFLLQGYTVSPLFLTTVRMLGAGALFIALLAITQRDALMAALRDRATRRGLLAFGGIGLLLSQLTYLISISYTNAGTATVLQSLAIVFVMLFTCVSVRRLPKAGEFLALVCAFGASLLIATKGDLGTLNLPIAGLAWGIVNALSVAFYLVQPRKLLERWGSLLVSGVGMALGGLVMLGIWIIACIAAPALGEQAMQLVAVPTFDLPGILVLALLVFIGSFAAFALYIHGVSIVGSVNGGLLGVAEPVSAMLFSALWLDTAFLWADWVGLALMAATILLVSLSGSKRQAEEAPTGAHAV